MPELDEVVRFYCESHAKFSHEVPSATNPEKKHTVRHEMLPPGFPTIYGFTCTCNGYKHRRHCKHIRYVRHFGGFCGWEGEVPDGVESGDSICPRCGRPAMPIKEGV